MRSREGRRRKQGGWMRRGRGRVHLAVMRRAGQGEDGGETGREEI
jgi:hypothetical protein